MSERRSYPLKVIINGREIEEVIPAGGAGWGMGIFHAGPPGI